MTDHFDNFLTPPAPVPSAPPIAPWARRFCKRIKNQYTVFEHPEHGEVIGRIIKSSWVKNEDQKSIQDFLFTLQGVTGNRIEVSMLKTRAFQYFESQQEARQHLKRHEDTGKAK